MNSKKQFDVSTLTQENTDGRKQDNICLSCFQVSITNAKYEMSEKDKH